MLIDREKIARFEKLAAENPKAYRFRLAAVAVLGDIVLTILRMIPVALLIALSSLFYGGWFFYALAATTFLLFLWLGRADFRVDGRVLERTDAPALFAEVDQLRTQLAVSGKIEIRLNDEFNAGATETRGLFGIIGTRRVLVLGVPLLAILSKAQVLAIVAHEFGHLSRRHGRLGHWLYRTRAGWLMYEECSGESAAILERAISWYGRAFVPYFSTLAFVHSRQCEYEADADAASVVGTLAFGQALANVIAYDKLFSDEMPQRMHAQMRQTPHAPDDYVQQLAHAAREVPAETRAAWLEAALQQEATSENTHPSLTQRLRALGIAPQLGALDNVAGESLLGAAWPDIMKAVNEAWQLRERRAWSLRHHYFRNVSAALLQVSDDVAASWPPARALTRARALAQHAPALGLDALKHVSANHPDSAEVSACLALTMLEQNDANGVAIADSIWQRAPRYRRRMAAALCGFYRSAGGSAGNTASFDAWKAKLQGVTESRAKLIDDFVQAAEADLDKTEVAPTGVDTLDDDVRLFLVAALADDHLIRAAWLFGGTRSIVTKSNPAGEALPMHMLALVIDPAAMKTAEQDEHQVSDCYHDALFNALPLGDEVMVTTYFSTEKLPERFIASNVLIDKRSGVPLA
jgi:Zn-dependent protease with chaperone function